MSPTPQTTTPAPVAAAPGKMTLAMRAAKLPPQDAPKVLRVGVLEDGRVRDERLMRRRETVRVGSREKNHFVLMSEDAPASHELFALRGDRWYLELAAGMSARVADDAGVVDVTPGGAVPLGEHSKGRVRIGNATVLFQFVVPPPLATRPQLPAAARGTVIRNMDWLFAAVVTVSLIVHGGFVGYLRNADWPMRDRWEYVPREVVEFMMIPPRPAAHALPPTPRDPDPTATPDPTTPDDPGTTPANPRPSPRPRPNRPNPPGNDRPTPRLPPDVSRLGINGILGNLSDRPGDVADVLAGGRVDVDQDSAFDQVRGVTPPTGDTSRLRPQGGEPGPVRPVGQIDQQIADQNIRTPDRDPEAPVHGIARPGAPPAPIGGTGTLRVADVRRVVNSALGGIQRCYERQLRNNPTLSGRVGITFTVTGAGTVSGARATDSFDPTVGTCVAGVISRLRFPEPEDGSVTFAFPFVFEPGQR